MAKESFVWEAHGVCTNATTFDLAFRPGPHRKRVALDRLAAVDDTTSPTLLILGVKHGATEVRLESWSAPGAGVVKAMTSRVFVWSDWLPFVRVTGAGVGDQIALYAFGYLTDANED